MVASFMPSIAFAAADPAGYDAQNIKCWDWTSGSTTATLKYVVDSNDVTKSVNAPATVEYTGGVKCGERVTGVDVTFKAKYSGHTYQYVYTDQTVDFPDHDYVTVPAKAATCTADGNKEYTYCKNCEDSDVPSSKVVAAAHHVDSLSSDSKYWDRSESGKVGIKKDAKVVCKDCGKTFTLEAPTTKVTLDEDGTGTGCSAAKVETADVIVDKNGAVDANDAYNTKPIIVAYSKTTPNATATDHTPGAWDFEWGEDNGINTTAKYVQKCTACGTVLKSYDAVVSVATDSEPGDVTCSTDGNLRLIAEYASQTGTKSDEHVIADYPALGHKYVYVAKKAATCKEDGVKEHYTCSVCENNFKVNDKTGKVLIQSGAPVAADEAFLKIDAAHNMEGTWTWTKNPAGTGFSTVTVKDLKCKTCGAVHNGPANATPVLVAEEVENPTCTKAGVNVFKATATGTSITPVGSSTPVTEDWTAEAKNEIEVKALGHDWNHSVAFDWDVDANGNPVCNVTLQKCGRCGELGKAYACEVVAEKMPEKTSSMTDAQYAAIVKAFEARNYAATCTKEGKVTAVASYKDDLGVSYNETKTVSLPKTNHKTEVIPAVAATVFAKGSTVGVKCSVCGEVLNAPEEVDTLKVGTAKISSLKAGKKSFTVKASAANATGYRVYYKKAGAKKYSYTTVKAKNLSKTVKKLSAGKKYTVKVKAYAKNYDGDGQVVWGALSSGKTVKVK